MSEQTSIFNPDEEQQGSARPAQPDMAVGQGNAAVPVAASSTAVNETPAVVVKKPRQPRKLLAVGELGVHPRGAPNGQSTIASTTTFAEGVRNHVNNLRQAAFLDTLWAKGKLTETEFKALMGNAYQANSGAGIATALCRDMLSKKGIAFNMSADIDAAGGDYALEYTLTEVGRAYLIEGGFAPSPIKALASAAT